VVGVWWLGRRWSAWAGLVASLYMAASPYAVFYGRSIWQPNLLAPLATLWTIAAYLGVTRTDRLAKFGVALNVFLGLFVVQVHFAGIALVPATLYLFARFRWWRSGRLVPTLIGAALAGIAALPYLYYVTVTAPGVLTAYGTTLGGSASIDGQGFENLLRLALGWDWAFLGMGDAIPFAPDFLSIAGPSGLVGIGLFFLLYWIIAVVRVRRVPPDDTLQAPHPQLDPSVEIILLLLIVSPLFFLRHSTPVLIHYELIALPALALLAGASTLPFQYARSKRPVVVLAMLVAVSWSYQIVETLSYTAANRPPNSALSSILRESRDAANAVADPVLFFTHGDDPAIDGEVAVFKTLLWERDHHILNGDNLLILPPYPATLLATLAPFQAWEEIEASGLALDVQEYPRREGALPFVATRYDGISEPQGFTLIDPIPFADGTELIGWRARRVGPRLRVSTLWRVTSDTAPGTYQQFHHLRTSDEGDPLAISDVPLSRATWRVGDRVIVMADFFDIAPGTENLSIDIGHYSLPDLTRISLADSPDSLVSLGTFTAP
jgi:hypothetical protein